jgi:hypothetical protein
MDYENIRDTDPRIPQDVRVRWIEADQAERSLRASYERVKSDEDITEDARARRLDEVYQRDGGRVAEKKRAARQALINKAKSLEKSALPKPQGENLDTSDPTRLLLIQGERERVRRVAEKRAERSPFKGTANADYLRSEYAKGIEVGGTKGAAICAGVLGAGEELGIDQDEIAGALRSDSQRAMLDDAQHLFLYRQMISESAPEPRGRRYGLGRRLSKAPERNRASVHLAGGGVEPIVAQDPGTGARGRRAKKGKKS